MAAYLIVGRTAVPVLGPDLDHGAQAGGVLRSVNNLTLMYFDIHKDCRHCWTLDLGDGDGVLHPGEEGRVVVLVDEVDHHGHVRGEARAAEVEGPHGEVVRLARHLLVVKRAGGCDLARGRVDAGDKR